MNSGVFILCPQKKKMFRKTFPANIDYSAQATSKMNREMQKWQ